MGFWGFGEITPPRIILSDGYVHLKFFFNFFYKDPNKDLDFLENCLKLYF